MIKYVTGNLLESSARALVNTVNCEGYMGKGIAYQFKLAFPENNKSYIEACKTGSLKTGTIHYYDEKEKIIINFPTKDKWRAKSKMEYIETGLEALVKLIVKLGISSIAVPPLGSGNGGLIWADVKNLIEKKLTGISETVDIFVYEPSRNYIAQPTVEPKLSTSALVLMNIKMNLKKFNSIRLQKTAYIMDILSEQKYFKFTKHKFGPYDHAIDVVSQSIKEFQKYHNTNSTKEAYNIALNKLISEKVEIKLNALIPAVKRAADYVNNIDTDKKLECITTILYILQVHLDLDESRIVGEFKKWSEDKARRFTENEIKDGIMYLFKTQMIEQTLVGFRIINNKRVDKNEPNRS